MPVTAQSPALKSSGFYLTFFFTLAVYLPFLNVYFRTLGLSGWQIGILSAAMPAGSFLAVPIVTLVADRHRRRVLLLALSVGGTAVALSLFLFPTRFLPLLAVMAFFAFCFSSIVPLADTSIVRMASRYSLNFGNLRLWGSLGYAISASVCGALWGRAGYRPMFVAAACCSLVVVGVSLTLEEAPHEPRPARTPYRDIAADRLLMGVLIATFLAASAIGMEFTFAGIYMSSLGGSGLMVGMLFGVSALFELPGMGYSLVVAARIGGGYSLVVAYALLAFAYLGYAASPSPFVLLAFSWVRGLGYGLFYVSTIHFLNGRAPKGWAATVQGVMNASAYGLGQLASRPLAGGIFDRFGPRTLYVVCASFAIAAAFVVVIMVGGNDMRDDSPTT